mgnify:CR=1 FL=1
MRSLCFTRLQNSFVTWFWWRTPPIHPICMYHTPIGCDRSSESLPLPLFVRVVLVRSHNPTISAHVPLWLYIAVVNSLYFVRVRAYLFLSLVRAHKTLSCGRIAPIVQVVCSRSICQWSQRLHAFSVAPTHFLCAVWHCAKLSTARPRSRGF